MKQTQKKKLVSNHEIARNQKHKFQVKNYESPILISIVRVLNTNEGRDKLCKILQYASRIVVWHFNKCNDVEMATRFIGIFKSFRQARKIFRLGKSLNEIYYIIQKIFKDKNDLENEIIRVLFILSKVQYALFWFFDNIGLLVSIKFFLKKPQPYHKIAKTFWLMALITNLFEIMRQLVANYIQKNQRFSKKNEIEQVDKNIKNLRLSLIRVLFDLLPAGEGSGFIEKVFNIKLNNGIVGLGGLISGLIALIQAF